jgi:hypothetical protein
MREFPADSSPAAGYPAGKVQNLLEHMQSSRETIRWLTDFLDDTVRAVRSLRRASGLT